VSIVRTAWSGTSGGPGVTQMAVDTIAPDTFWTPADMQDIVDEVKLFWDTIDTFIPSDIQLNVLPTIDNYETIDGDLVGSNTVAVAPATVTGGWAGGYSMASGFRINLLTSDIINNRRVRGAWFVVPASINIYDSAGQIDSTTRTAVVAALNTLKTNLATVNAGLYVWSRKKELPEPRDGQISPVTGFTVSSKVAVLRGRRD
jgi:hypothetical protein